MAARDDESIIQICGGRAGGCGGGQTFDYFLFHGRQLKVDLP
jgi:hypothetical protein